MVYEPLLKRLPSDTPMYGFERVEGSVEERAAEYLPKLREIQGDGPYILVGWSLGGALAYACAIGLAREGADVKFVGLIDMVRPGKRASVMIRRKAATASIGRPTGSVPPSTPSSHLRAAVCCCAWSLYA